jgi:hypothetical protein
LTTFVTCRAPIASADATATSTSEKALPFEAGGEGDQSRVVAHRQGSDRGGVDPAGQEGADGDVGAHVLGTESSSTAVISS